MESKGASIGPGGATVDLHSCARVKLRILRCGVAWPPSRLNHEFCWRRAVWRRRRGPVGIPIPASAFADDGRRSTDSKLKDLDGCGRRGRKVNIQGSGY